MKATEWVATLTKKEEISTLIKGTYLKGFPEPRIALVGRSNVGKSSFINALLGQKLARVSQTPGKTRTIHFYAWKDGDRLLADLPGYGFAKAAKQEQEKWQSFIADYLKQDPGLECVFLLLDSRHGPTENDLDALRFLLFYEIPIAFVFTKVDTLKNQSDRARRKKEIQTFLKEQDLDDIPTFWVSVQDRKSIQAVITSLLRTPSEGKIEP